MSNGEPVLSQNQESAIVALLEKPTVREAAASVGVAESTVHRWLRENDLFQTSYRKAQRSLYDHAMGRLQNATAEAAATLREIMTSKEAPETARVTAARTVLDFARSNINLQELEDRVTSLEAQAKGEKPR